MEISSASAYFDRAYRRPVTLWGDVRIPQEVKALASQAQLLKVLELGCGTGRVSAYLADRGLQVTGVDFSQVAIAAANKRVAGQTRRPEFVVADVPQLDVRDGPFDGAVDIGCFHCLDDDALHAYVARVATLLRPGGTHLIWAMDSAPGGPKVTPAVIETTFADRFDVVEQRKSRRRLVSSHWYWLQRIPG